MGTVLLASTVPVTCVSFQRRNGLSKLAPPAATLSGRLMAITRQISGSRTTADRSVIAMTILMPHSPYEPKFVELPMAARLAGGRPSVRSTRCGRQGPVGPIWRAMRGPNGPVHSSAATRARQEGPVLRWRWQSSGGGGRCGWVDAGLEGVTDKVRAPARAGLVPDTVQVRSDRIHRQEQPLGDLGVCRPRGQQRDDLPLSCRQQAG